MKLKALTFHHELDFDLSKIEPQNGLTCKLTALANLDRFYSDKGVKYLCLPVNKATRHGFFRTDLNKNATLQPPSRVSLRQLAKKIGSVQGELLEINQVVYLLNSQLGYRSTVFEIPTIEQLRTKIIEELAKNQPIIGFFNVDSNGLPLINIANNREHACLITGYFGEKDEIRITHWGVHYRTALKTFFMSNQQLSVTREAEHYKSYKNIYTVLNNFFKLSKSSQQCLVYEAVVNKYEDAEHSFAQLIKNICNKEPAPTPDILMQLIKSVPVFKSLTPKTSSGFKSKIICTQSPSAEEVQVMREMPQRIGGLCLAPSIKRKRSFDANVI